MKAIDPEYEVYWGVGRVRQAFSGGVWVTVRAWDIGRAPSAMWKPEPVEDRRIMGVAYRRGPGRERGPLAQAVRRYLRVRPDGASPKEIVQAVSDGSNYLRERVQQILTIYPDWFGRVGYGRWVCKE